MVLYVACVILRIFININSVIMRIVIMRMDTMSIVIMMFVIMGTVMILKPVQLVQMEDGEHDRQDVDEDPDGVQHIVAVRTLRPRLRIFFRTQRC